MVICNYIHITRNKICDMYIIERIRGVSGYFVYEVDNVRISTSLTP